MAVFILTFAFTQGVFPKPPDFSDLPAFDLSLLRAAPEVRRCSCSRCSAIAALAVVAIMSARVRAFWSRVRQGLTILQDHRRYFREVWAIQFIGWLFRFTAFWFLLEAST